MPNEIVMAKISMLIGRVTGSRGSTLVKPTGDLPSNASYLVTLLFTTNLSLYCTFINCIMAFSL